MTITQAGAMVVSAVVAGILAWAAARTNKPGARENLFMDQLQEQLQAERDERKALSARVDGLAARVNILTARDGLWELHAIRVEGQVSDMGGVPVTRPDLLRAQQSELLETDPPPNHRRTT